MSDGVSRRGLLAGAAATVAGSVLSVPQPKSAAPARSVRVAFMTDVHLDTNDRCIRGFTNCLKKIHALADRPDLIIQGGDIIYDALVREEGNVQRQYNLARELLSKHCSI